MTTPDPYQEHKDREHLRDCRRQAVGRILGDMLYQTRPGIHTMGPCSNFADAFTTAFYEARRIEGEIWEEVER